MASVTLTVPYEMASPERPTLLGAATLVPIHPIFQAATDPFLPVRAARSGAGQQSSYWDDLDPQQQQESINLEGGRAFGGRQAWWPAGAVLQRWNDELIGRIRRIHNEKCTKKWIYKRLKRHPASTTELWMIKKDAGATTARPTIVAKCLMLEVAQRMLAVVQKNLSFIELNLGFDYLAWNDDLRQTGGLEDHTAYPRLGGSRIMTFSMPISPLESGKCATLGGVLLLNQQYFGLTIAHAFYDVDEAADHVENAEQADNETNWEDVIDCPPTVLDASDEGSDEDSEESSELSTPARTVVYIDTTDQDAPALYSAVSGVSTSSNRLSFVGYLPDGRERTLQGVPRQDNHYISKWISTRLDWALIRIHDPRFFTPNRFVTPDKRVIIPSRTSSSPPRGKVFVATNTNSLRTSYCSGVKCGITLPNADEMHETWVLDISCSPGECGSWVIGAESEEGILHGIIVASSEDRNLSYLIPAEDIFRDIKAKWRNEIRPTDQILPVDAIETSTAFIQAGIPTPLEVVRIMNQIPFPTLAESRLAEGHSTSSTAMRDVTQQPSRWKVLPADFEGFDARSRMQQPDFFVPGRVFAMLWYESWEGDSGILSDRGIWKKEDIITEIRQMVVVRAGQNSCWCSPILTYRGHGVATAGLSREETEYHAVVYMSGRIIIRMMDESLSKQLIEVVPAHFVDPHQLTSRLNFEKVYTVEHNIRVMDLGLVQNQDMPYFHMILRAFMADESKDVAIDKRTTTPSKRPESPSPPHRPLNTNPDVETRLPSMALTNVPYLNPSKSNAMASGVTNKSPSAETNEKISPNKLISYPAAAARLPSAAYTSSIHSRGSKDYEGLWQCSSGGRLYRTLVIKGKQYIQLDHENGPVREKPYHAALPPTQ